MSNYNCKCVEDIKNVAEFFAKKAKKGQCYALTGNLGSGKTTFVQYFIRMLNPQIRDVTSPTFNIVQSYPSDIAEIKHVDCYRLKFPEEFEELGLDETFLHCITLIEWPSMIEKFLPEDTIKLNFTRYDNFTKIRVG